MLADWGAKRATVRIVDRTVTGVKVDQGKPGKKKQIPRTASRAPENRGKSEKRGTSLGMTA
jgi:hypothetical protein